MAGYSSEDLCNEYCEKRYVTRYELRRILGSQLIDYQWNILRKFRDENRCNLFLRSINNSRFGYTSTQTLDRKFADYEDRLNRMKEIFSDISERPDERRKMNNAVYLTLLRAASQLDEKTVDDLTLKAMINGLYREDNPEHYSILGYRDVLRAIESGRRIEYNEDYLAEIYGMLTGQEGELVSFFREKDQRSRYARSSLEAVYDECPADRIEACMSSYWYFYRTEAISPLMKAMITLYFFHYLKPFESCNDLMALLCCKTILSQSKLGPCSALLPLENLLAKSPNWDEMDSEIQRQADLTYIFYYFMERSSSSLSEELNFFLKIKKEGIQSEVNALPASNETETSISKVIPQGEPAPSPIPETKQEEIPLPAVEESKLDVEKEEATETETPSPAPELKEAPPKPNPNRPAPVLPEKRIDEGELAVVIPKKEIAGKDLRDAAKYIYETNPQISRTQASFFATHCTMGCYYSIQDYKRHVRCAYETARTSMDNLTRYGFYRKLQFKNKFVYTPLNQKGESSK